jgi:hypothetical protein
MIAIGVFLGIWGVALMKVAIFLAVTGAVFGLTSQASFGIYGFFSGKKDDDIPHVACWVMGGVSLLLGIGAGVYIMNCLHIGMSVISAVGGYGFGNLISVSFGLVEKSPAVHYIVCVGFAIIGVILTVYFSEKIIAFFSAFAAGYLFVRGTTLIFMGYPDTFSEKYGKKDLAYWLSIAGLVVITGLSTVL